MDPFGLIFVACGAFAMAGAILDWDFFMNSRKAALLVTLLSRNGARIFYTLLGLGLAILGFLMTFKIIESSS